jgi:hypothetical protein
MASLRRSPDAVKAIIGVTAVNAIGSAVAIALLPLAEQAWRADRTQFGVATAAVGLGAFAAPLLQRLWGVGTTAWRRSVLAVASALLLVAVASGLCWAIVPLTVMGTAMVHLEAVATTVIQRSVPDDVRSSVLGLTDSVMVAAAAGAAMVAPLVSVLVGPRGLIALAAAGALGLLVVATGEARAESVVAAGATGTSVADSTALAGYPRLTPG